MGAAAVGVGRPYAYGVPQSGDGLGSARYATRSSALHRPEQVAFARDAKGLMQRLASSVRAASARSRSQALSPAFPQRGVR